MAVPPKPIRHAGKGRPEGHVGWASTDDPHSNYEFDARETDLCRLIQYTNHNNFLSHFAKFAHLWLDAEQVTIIRAPAQHAVSLLYGENFRRPTLMPDLWDDYATRFCRIDPLLKRVDSSNRPMSSVCYLSNETINDTSYYKNMFARPSLQDKLSVVSRLDNEIILINMYRGQHAQKSPNIKQTIIKTFAVAAAAVEAHLRPVLQSQPVKGEMPLDLSSIPALQNLSERECEVCRHILRGLSLEGISLEMQLSFNTIITYKRRAFTKLNISTQKELFHLAYAKSGNSRSQPLAPALADM
jgi:DNA-binding CsgD family transcriptional regulator